MPIIIIEKLYFFLRNSKSKRRNNSKKMLDGVVFSCQQNRVNTLEIKNFAQFGSLLIYLFIFSSTFRRKKIELLSSLRRQRLGRLSFLSESISQKLSKVSIWNLEYLFTNTFYKCIEFQLNSFDSYWEILIILKQYT
jgi:hypothetical protein